MAQSRFFWCHTMPTIMPGSSSGIQMPWLKTVELCASKKWFSLTVQFSKLQTFHRVGRQFGSGLAVHGHDGSDQQIQMMRLRKCVPAIRNLDVESDILGNHC